MQYIFSLYLVVPSMEFDMLWLCDLIGFVPVYLVLLSVQHFPHIPCRNMSRRKRWSFHALPIPSSHYYSHESNMDSSLLTTVRLGQCGLQNALIHRRVKPWRYDWHIVNSLFVRYWQNWSRCLLKMTNPRQTY